MTPSATASTTWRPLQAGPSLTPIQRISAGATTMSPTASPSHHVNQKRRAGGADIREERAGEDRGPDAVAEQHEGGKRDTGGRPDRGDRAVDVCESEPELRGEIVDSGEAEQQRHPPHGLVHLA